MFKPLPNRPLDTKIREGLLAVRHWVKIKGLYTVKRAVEKQALLATVREAHTVSELKQVLIFLIEKEYGSE